MGRYIYKHPVNGIKDIKEINQLIRSDVRKARDRKALLELYRRSGYLITLTHSPVWKKRFRGKVKKMRKVAREEFYKTTTLINKKIMGRKLDPIWGD